MPYASREKFTVRVPRRQPGTPAGVGFIVVGHVVTCAHVVNAALGKDLRSQAKPGPDDLVQVDFPILSGAADMSARSCRVIAWEPPAVTGVSGGDLAVLQVAVGTLPPGSGSARLMDPGAAHGARVAVFGYPQYPEKRRDGGWAWLCVSGGVGGGLIQLDAAGEAAFRAQPGYSGSPVVALDAAGDTVIGIFSAASVDGLDPDSYAIPVSALVLAWPEATGALAAPAGGYRVDPYGSDLPSGIAAYGSYPAATPAYRPVRELPLAPQDFSGRSDEVRRLTGWLTAGQAPRMASIYGIPGSGKTALALRVAQDIAADYPDCQLHFDLRASDQSPVSVETLLGHKLVQLGVPVSEVPTGLEARAEAYRSRIAGQRSLIVVDNATSPDQVRPLLPGYSDAAVIVTSWTLIPGLGPHALRLPPLADDAGGRVEPRSRRARPGRSTSGRQASRQPAAGAPDRRRHHAHAGTVDMGEAGRQDPRRVGCLSCPPSRDRQSRGAGKLRPRVRGAQARYGPGVPAARAGAVSEDEQGPGADAGIW
jgi:hypothetical protein